MPAFTFEKIAPTEQRGSLSVSSQPPLTSFDNEQRGTVIQVLGRFVEARVLRSVSAEQAPSRRTLPK